MYHSLAFPERAGVSAAFLPAAESRLCVGFNPPTVPIFERLKDTLVQSLIDVTARSNKASMDAVSRIDVSETLLEFF